MPARLGEVGNALTEEVQARGQNQILIIRHGRFGAP